MGTKTMLLALVVLAPACVSASALAHAATAHPGERVALMSTCDDSSEAPPPPDVGDKMGAPPSPVEPPKPAGDTDDKAGRGIPPPPPGKSWDQSVGTGRSK